MATPIPKTVDEFKVLRANCKRKVTNLLKEADILLKAGDGLPSSEYLLIVDKVRTSLDEITDLNSHMIRLKTERLAREDYETDADLEAAEDAIADTEEKYFNDLAEKAVPVTHTLIKHAEKVKEKEKAAKVEHPAVGLLPATDKTPRSRMEKLKFPKFSGDMRDYRRFKENFEHFSKHLDEKERFYQLIESMEKNTEKRKIKGCLDIKRAWEILDESYGDNDRLLELLLNDLEQLNTYELSKGKYDLKAMEHFVESVRSFATNVETIKMKEDLNGRMLLTQLRRKLPEDHRIQFLQSVADGKTEDSVNGLVQWLHKLLILLQKVKIPDKQSNVSKHDTSKPASFIPGNKFKKSGSHSATFSGSGNQPPKCPLHPNMSSHYLKGCNKFRNLPLNEKFNVMNANGICHRCGHNNCVAGKPPFKQEDCQFIANCQIPTCGMNTHFTSICPRVYGLDGYRHFDRKLIQPNHASTGPINAAAAEFIPTTPTASTSNASNYKVGHVARNGISCALPTVMAYLHHGSKKSLVRILLDTGSQISLIREGIVSTSKGNRMQDFSLTTVGGATMKKKLRVLECTLKSLDGSFSRDVQLTEMKTPCGDAPRITNQQIRQYPHLRDVTIDEAPNDTIDVLLGVENGDIFMSDEQLPGQSPHDPIGVKCPLGWYVQGGYDPDSNNLQGNAVIHYLNVVAVSELEEFLGLESSGLAAKPCKCYEEETNRNATISMQRSIKQLRDGTYEIGLPWTKSPEELPNNFEYAVKRLKNLESQFKDKPVEWNVYCKQMQDQLDRGVARLVPTAEFEKEMLEGRKMWFLPHFGVLKDSLTTPVRVVYDSKARYQGHSLNDYLAKGDNLNTKIFDVALRFRENEIGIIADISKMFQAIKVTPEDARFHRYVFRESTDQPIKVYELSTVTFGDKPSPTAAIIALRHVVAENAPENPEMQRIVQEQFYVDDLNESLRSTEKAALLKTDLVTTLSKGNFAIRKFLSNDRMLCDPEFYPTDGNVTALGTVWHLENDTLRVKPVRTDNLIATKRNILKKTAQYYDVFGMLSGILVKPKILLQKLWLLDIDWDTPIPPDNDLHRMLTEIQSELEEVQNIEIERCLIPKKFQHLDDLPRPSLHGLSDASEDAMGIGVWLRWSQNEEEEDAELTFVCARARLTPLKQQSIPRKELQAVLLLSRLMQTIKHATRFKLLYQKIWTDSLTAIHWLRGQSKSYRSYVACRVGEITTEFDPIHEIAYVPTDKNVIDLISRGCNAGEMKSVIQGPEYLRQPPAYWPEMPKIVPNDKEDSELKKFYTRNAKVLTAKLESAEPIVEPTRFSSWSRLVMVTARLLSLKDLPKKLWLKELLPKIAEFPSCQRIKEAKIYWIRFAQRSLDFNNNNIMKLHPFLDNEGVYRVGGRIDKAPLSYDLRHPHLIPKNCHIGLLITRERHLHALHAGHLRTAVEVRKNFWIIGDVNLAKRVVRDCKVCRRHRGKAITQQMANLPSFRLMPFSPPFKSTLVDYLGPVNVKISRNTVMKGYCALFVCAVLGAVHLTCVQDLSTSAFLQALERFISTRGAPTMIVCDNATCFRGADNEIRELKIRLDPTQIQSETLRFQIEWRFGPPAGPHHQGLVERMVQEVKKGMKHLVKADKLTFPEWETVFSQIAGLINSRPITVSSSSPLDEPPITPNHFLIGRGELPNPQVPCEEFIGNLTKRRELCNEMVNNFWKRWMSNIHRLSPRNKWKNEQEEVKEGDVVLIIEDNVKRGHWKMAEVTRVHVGDGGLVRVVEIRTADGKVLKRPVTKLVMLMKSDERDK